MTSVATSYDRLVVSSAPFHGFSLISNLSALFLLLSVPADFQPHPRPEDLNVRAAIDSSDGFDDMPAFPTYPRLLYLFEGGNNTFHLTERYPLPETHFDVVS